jgi:hypothetical protein
VPGRPTLIGIGARAVPNSAHVRSLRFLQPQREDIDVFPTVYRLNTIADLKRHFPPDQWDHMTYGWDPELSYGGHHSIVQRAGLCLSRVTPESMRAVWLIFLRRR